MGPSHSRFNPHLLSPETLEALFVAREPQLQGLVDAYAGQVQSGGARYELLLGPRGIGKSHLLALFRHRLLARSEAQGRAVVVALDEEEHVGSLLGLLDRILRQLGPAAELQPGPERNRELMRLPPEQAEQRLCLQLRQRLEGQPLVLCLENLDRIFEAIEEDGQQRLRGILQMEGNWSVLASSQTWGPLQDTASRPFYQTFAIQKLGLLDVEQCAEQLLRLARQGGREELVQEMQQSKSWPRFRSIHHLTHGNPRSLALLLPYLERGGLDRLEEAFYALGDELTPYYQEQIRARAPAQQALLEELSRQWRPMTVRDLAAERLMSEQTASKQLKLLRDDGLVARLEVGRESYYEISDPLWRIARAMKHPQDAPRFFIRFLRHWHSWEEHGRLPEELAAQVRELTLREEQDCAAAAKALVAEARELSMGGQPQEARRLLSEGWSALPSAALDFARLSLEAMEGGPQGLGAALRDSLHRSGPTAALCAILANTLFPGAFAPLDPDLAAAIADHIPTLLTPLGDQTPEQQLFVASALVYAPAGPEQVAQLLDLLSPEGLEQLEAMDLHPRSAALLVERALRHGRPEVLRWMDRPGMRGKLRLAEYAAVAAAQEGLDIEQIRELVEHLLPFGVFGGALLQGGGPRQELERAVEELRVHPREQRPSHPDLELHLRRPLPPRLLPLLGSAPFQRWREEVQRADHISPAGQQWILLEGWLLERMLRLASLELHGPEGEQQTAMALQALGLYICLKGGDDERVQELLRSPLVMALLAMSTFELLLTRPAEHGPLIGVLEQGLSQSPEALPLLQLSRLPSEPRLYAALPAEWRGLVRSVLLQSESPAARALLHRLPAEAT